MSVEKITQYISEQVLKDRGLGLDVVSESTDHDKHFEKANDVEYNGRDYSSHHEFTSPHDHKTIVKMYRNHIKQAQPNNHSRLTRADTYSDGDSHDTDFHSHSSNLERHGHNTIHSIETTKTKDGYKHTISQRENNER